MTTTRRTLFKHAALAGVALAAPQIMVRAAFADGHNAGTPAAFSKFKLGDFTVTILSDGQSVRDNPASLFGGDMTTPEEVGALLADNFLPQNQITLSFSQTLVDTGDQRILFDTGSGEGGVENGLGQMTANLAAAGYAPDQIDIVVISHMHPDHIGGLMAGGAPAFPNARYVTGQAEYDFWTSTDRVGTPIEGLHQMANAMVVPLAEQTTFIGDGAEIASGVNAMAAFGHTPGHMIYRVESGGQAVVITSDTSNHFVLSLQRPDWPFSFDADPVGAAASRKQVFDMIANDRVPFIGYHMPFPSVGFIEPLDGGYRFIPETDQLAL